MKPHRQLRYLWYDNPSSRIKSKRAIYGGLEDHPTFASVFAWTDPAVTAAVVRAANRAKRAGRAFEAHILLDAGGAHAGNAADRAIFDLKKCGARIYLVTGRTASSLMHTKFSVVDGRVVYVGSVNYSHQGQCDNVEVALVDRRVSSAVAFQRRLLKWLKRKDITEIAAEKLAGIERRLAKAKEGRNGQQTPE